MDKARAQRMAQELAGQKVGGWELGSLLGNGGSALVFLGVRGDQKAAVKIIDPELEEKFGKENQEIRVGHELKLVGRIHPHLVRIYDAGRCLKTEFLYVAMEFLPYRNLDEVAGRVPKEKISTIIGQVAQAAQFLESIDICHRDIKPENIVVDPTFDRAILLDLGILRPMDPHESAGTGGNFIGTVRYSPPEFVWRKEQYTVEAYRAITFYQLGAVLHDLIMGYRIFNDVPGPMAALIQVITEQTPSINSSDVDQKLINLARDCLHKDFKTRLMLVNWKSFDFSEKTISNPKDRIKARILSGISNKSENYEKKSLNRDYIAAIGRNIRDQMRNICVKDPFLSRATVDYVVSEGKVEIWVDFESHPELQLNGGARLTIAAVPVDEDITILKAVGSWKSPNSNARWCKISPLRSSNENITEELECMIYALVANAMGNPNPLDHEEINIL